MNVSATTAAKMRFIIICRLLGIFLVCTPATRHFSTGAGEQSSRIDAALRTSPYPTTRITASISTVIWFGSEPIPTAERACRPRSPSTATNKSEQPLITFG